MGESQGAQEDIGDRGPPKTLRAEELDALGFRRMGALTRLWLLPERRARPSWLAEGVVRAEIGEGAARPMALADYLSACARSACGAQLWLNVPAPRLCEAVVLVLGLSAAQARGVSKDLDLVCIDWPTGVQADARPALVGVDLNWQPPWDGGKVSRYPGGPAAAAGSR